MYIIEKNNKLNFNHLFGQIFNKIWIFKVYVFIMFKIKYLINKMQCNTLSQQVWWFDGKGVYMHVRGQKVKFHKWCSGV
jgi:hypothetical protein